MRDDLIFVTSHEAQELLDKVDFCLAYYKVHDEKGIKYLRQVQRSLSNFLDPTYLKQKQEGRYKFHVKHQLSKKGFTVNTLYKESTSPFPYFTRTVIDSKVKKTLMALRPRLELE